MDNRVMKNLFLLGSLSFSIAFSLGMVVEKDATKSAAIGGIATISTLGSAVVLNKKYEQEIKNLQGNILQLIDSKIQSKSAIEQEYNTINSEVNALKQEIISLNTERDNLQKLISSNENKNQEILQLIESQNQSKTAIEKEVNHLNEQIISLHTERDNLQKLISSNENKNQEILQLIENQTQSKTAIETEVNHLNEQIISLNTERDNLQNLISNLKDQERQLSLLIENQTQLKTTVEEEYNSILAKNPENQDKNFIEIDNFIEKNTSYSQKLESIPKDFLSIYRYNIDIFSSQVPVYKRRNYWGKLERGASILSEEEQLFTYFACYGGKHYYKLLYLLKKFFSSQMMQSKSNTNIHIEIIDYGCGQALATICLLDYLKQNNLHSIIIDNITLIEPSEICLSRGILHINHLRSAPYYPQIKLVNKGLQQLNANDLSTSSQNIKLHIFANILDLAGFEINKLANTIRESQSGINYFLCVSPIDKHSRIQDFFDFWHQNQCHVENIQLSSEHLHEKIWNYNTNEFIENRIYRIHKLFHVNL
jgi:hypothetical protein